MSTRSDDARRPTPLQASDETVDWRGKKDIEMGIMGESTREGGFLRGHLHEDSGRIYVDNCALGAGRAIK